MSKVLLPSSVGSIAAAADHYQRTRFGLDCVLVETNDGKYTLTATNSRLLVIVTGENKSDTGYGQSRIPVEEWERVFQCLESKKANINVTIGETGTTFARTPIKPPQPAEIFHQLSATVSHVEGRYPPVKETMSSTKKKCETAGTCRFRLSSRELSYMLQVVNALVDQDDDVIDFEVPEGGESPILATARGRDVVKIEAVIMPCAKS